jgi:hypothetical protein
MQKMEKNANLCNQYRVLRIGERVDKIALDQEEAFNEQKRLLNEQKEKGIVMVKPYQTKLTIT